MTTNKIKRLKLTEAQLQNLPLFYNFIIYNYMTPGIPHYHFNERYQYYINYCTPEKKLSKILKRQNEQ